VKRWFLVSVILLMVSLLLVGCGVPKEDYEAVVAERDAVVADLDKAQQELQSVKAELETAQTKYETFKTDLESSCSKMDKLLAVNHYVLGINSAFAINDLKTIEEQCTHTAARMADVTDSELKSLWESAYTVEAGRWELQMVPYKTFMDRLRFLINSNVNSIRDKLAE